MPWHCGTAGWLTPTGCPVDSLMGAWSPQRWAPSRLGPVPASRPARWNVLTVSGPSDCTQSTLPGAPGARAWLPAAGRPQRRHPRAQVCSPREPLKWSAQHLPALAQVTVQCHDACSAVLQPRQQYLRAARPPAGAAARLAHTCCSPLLPSGWGIAWWMSLPPPTALQRATAAAAASAGSGGTPRPACSCT